MTETVKIKLLDRNGANNRGDIVDAVHISGTLHEFTDKAGVVKEVWTVTDEAAAGIWDGIIVEANEPVVNEVEHPTHYNAVEGMPEVWDILDAFFTEDPLLWNAGKYLLRSGKKPGNNKLQELEKLQQYVQRRIDSLKNGGTDD